MKSMQHSPLRLRVSTFSLLGLLVGVLSTSISLVHADESPYYGDRFGKPAVSAPDNGSRSEAFNTLGGPAVAQPRKSNLPQTKINVNAATRPNDSNRNPRVLDNRTGNGASGPKVILAAENPTKPVDNTQPPAAFGPTPFNLDRVRALQIGSQVIPDTPMRVGNLDVLAPIVDYAGPLGISITQANPKNTPTLFNTSPSDFFQINLPTGTPIVLAVNRAIAWGKDENGQPFETPLRSAPLVINQKLFLPVFSIAPLIGAATRLNVDGTLLMTPTIESVELFPVANTVAVTIKSSAPVPEGAFKVGMLRADARNANRIFVDFTGFSMGFDAGNSTSVRLVANGTGDVTGVRAGQPSTLPNPEVTRVTFDLKRPLSGEVMRIEADPTLFAMVLAEPRVAQNPIVDTTPDEFLPAPLSVAPASNSTVSQPLKGISIVLDAGHGGKDAGARGKRSYEKQHTLALATKTARYLRARGATVHMTRIGDTYPSLSDRVNFANSRRADLFISIHMNASVNKNSRGTETFFYTGQSRNFANSVHSEFAKATGRANRGIAQARFYVIRNTSMPSLLLECAFVSNQTEESVALTDAWREKVSKGITQGVVNYAVRYMGVGLSG